MLFLTWSWQDKKNKKNKSKKNKKGEHKGPKKTAEDEAREREKTEADEKRKDLLKRARKAYYFIVCTLANDLLC